MHIHHIHWQLVKILLWLSNCFQTVKIIFTLEFVLWVFVKMWMTKNSSYPGDLGNAGSPRRDHKYLQQLNRWECIFEITQSSSIPRVEKGLKPACKLFFLRSTSQPVKNKASLTLRKRKELSVQLKKKKKSMWDKQNETKDVGGDEWMWADARIQRSGFFGVRILWLFQQDTDNKHTLPLTPSNQTVPLKWMHCSDLFALWQHCLTFISLQIQIFDQRQRITIHVIHSFYTQWQWTTVWLLKTSVLWSVDKIALQVWVKQHSQLHLDPFTPCCYCTTDMQH